MDDLEKRFRDFLADPDTDRRIDRIAKNLDELHADDVKQTIKLMLLEKKDKWPTLFQLSSPWAYIRRMAVNRIKDEAEESTGGDAHRNKVSFYFRKRMVDSLRASDDLTLFSHGNRRRDLYFSRRSSSVKTPTPVPEWMIGEVPLDFQKFLPDITAVKKREKMVEMALVFLEYWERRDGRPLAVPVNALWIWLTRHIEITEVFREDERAFETESGYENMSPEEDRMESFKSPDAPGMFDHDRHVVMKRLTTVMDGKEKTCLALYLDGKTFDEIARDTGYRGPSGSKAVIDRAIGKIRKALETLGYGKDRESLAELEPGGALFRLLKEILK